MEYLKRQYDIKLNVKGNNKCTEIKLHFLLNPFYWVKKEHNSFQCIIFYT